jgi:hypothetical protein
MAYNENFLFFNETTDDANATGEGAMYTSSQFIGANVTGAKEVTLHFESRAGIAQDDVVVVTQTTSNVKNLMQELAAVLSNARGGFFLQSDFVGDNAPNNDGFLSGISGIVITSANS